MNVIILIIYHYKIPIIWFHLYSLHKFYQSINQINQSIYQFTVGLIQNHVTDFVKNTPFNNTAVVVVSTQLNQRQ